MSNVAILRNPLLLVIKKDYSLWFALLKLSTKMRFLREFCHSSWLINTWALFASICSCELVDACNHFAAQQQNMRPLIHSLRCQAKFRSDEDMSRNIHDGVCAWKSCLFCQWHGYGSRAIASQHLIRIGSILAVNAIWTLNINSRLKAYMKLWSGYILIIPAK